MSFSDLRWGGRRVDDMSTAIRVVFFRVFYAYEVLAENKKIGKLKCFKLM